MIVTELPALWCTGDQHICFGLMQCGSDKRLLMLVIVVHQHLGHQVPFLREACRQSDDVTTHVACQALLVATAVGLFCYGFSVVQCWTGGKLQCWTGGKLMLPLMVGEQLN